MTDISRFSLFQRSLVISYIDPPRDFSNSCSSWTGGGQCFQEDGMVLDQDSLLPLLARYALLRAPHPYPHRHEGHPRENSQEEGICLICSDSVGSCCCCCCCVELLNENSLNFLSTIYQDLFFQKCVNFYLWDVDTSIISLHWRFPLHMNYWFIHSCCNCNDLLLMMFWLLLEVVLIMQLLLQMAVQSPWLVSQLSSANFCRKTTTLNSLYTAPSV